MTALRTFKLRLKVRVDWMVTFGELVNECKPLSMTGMISVKRDGLIDMRVEKRTAEYTIVRTSYVDNPTERFWQRSVDYTRQSVSGR